MKSASPEEKLDASQVKFLAALLEEPTIGKAASVAGVSTRTGMRYLQDDDFKEAFSEVKRAAVAQALARVQSVAGFAVAALVQVMADKKTPPSARVSAARTLLESALKAAELEGFEERLAELERHMAQGIPAAPAPVNGRARTWG